MIGQTKKNQKISELFGLSYSSVGRRVGILREKLRVDKTFKKEYDGISALIKMKVSKFSPDLAKQLGMSQPQKEHPCYLDKTV